MHNASPVKVYSTYGIRIAYNGHTYVHSFTLTEFLLQHELLKDVHDVVLAHLVVYHGYLVFL